MNQKQVGSHYLKSEEQTLWGRGKKQAKNTEANAPQEVRLAFVVFRDFLGSIGFFDRDVVDQMLS